MAKARSLKPKPKVAAATGGAGAATAIVIILGQFGVDVTAEAAGAVVTLVAFIAGYFKAE